MPRLHPSCTRIPTTTPTIEQITHPDTRVITTLNLVMIDRITMAMIVAYMADVTAPCPETEGTCQGGVSLCLVLFCMGHVLHQTKSVSFVRLLT